LDNQPRFIYDNDTLLRKQKCQDAWLSGLHTAFLSISAGCLNASMMVIRFRPAGAFPLIGLPLNELKDLVVDADLVFGPSIFELREALLATPTGLEKMRVARRWFLNRLQGGAGPHAAMNRAVEWMHRDASLTTLARIAEVSGFSQKHFIHLFKQHVGLAPKVYQRIVRFNRVLNELESQRTINWTTLSHDCGYYDQSHFIREFNQFAGFNPGEYLREQGEYVHYVPVA
jgi:AraC-like DNA-binding protein